MATISFLPLDDDVVTILTVGLRLYDYRSLAFAAAAKYGLTASSMLVLTMYLFGEPIRSPLGA